MRTHKSTVSRVVSYAAISASAGTLLLTIGAYTGLGEFFWYFAAGACVFITFPAGSILGSFLSFAACALLSLLTTGFNIVFLLPYLIFFGAYPVLVYIESRAGKYKWLIIALACIWFDASMYVFYLFTKLFVTEIAFINDNIILIILTGGTLVFFLYRFFMNKTRKQIEIIIKKHTA